MQRMDEWLNELNGLNLVTLWSNYHHHHHHNEYTWIMDQKYNNMDKFFEKKNSICKKKIQTYKTNMDSKT